MLNSRKAQASLMMASIGIAFGAALAPIPNVASDYILSNVFFQMDVYYDDHQSAIEAVKLASTGSTSEKYMLHGTEITSEVNSTCEASDGVRYYFEKFTLGGSCAHTIQMASKLYAANDQNPLSSPARISFYDTQEKSYNSMYANTLDYYG